jgi:hypothetical protein
VLNFGQGERRWRYRRYILDMMDISLSKKKEGPEELSKKKLQKIDSVNYILTIKRNTIIICIREDEKTHNPVRQVFMSIEEEALSAQ